MTERSARTFTSRIRSSSLRCRSSALSIIGLADSLGFSSMSSVPLDTVMPDRKGAVLGMGMLRAGGPSKGRKLLRFAEAESGVGDGGASRFADGEGIRSLSVDGLCRRVGFGDVISAEFGVGGNLAFEEEAMF